MKNLVEYDSKGDTLDHIRKVQRHIGEMIRHLLVRAQVHDESKLMPPEKPYFDEWTPKLSGVTYGSDEYRDMLKQMKPAIDHHYSVNRHHSEYHTHGISDMTLIDFMEMLCDWKAATERHSDGNIMRSLEINSGRFNMAPEIVGLLKNTIQLMRWDWNDHGKNHTD